MPKNIVALSDGTWANKAHDTKTNIALLYDYLPQNDQQVVKYNPGIGTYNEHYWFNELRNIWSGMTGEGINQDIKNLYLFICSNYEPGDAIYLFGFSRGAYTVRSLAGMIRKAGILKQQYADKSHVNQAFNIYREERHLGHNPGPDSDSAKKFRQQFTHYDEEELKANQPVQFLGVFDTVGDLGVPVVNYGYIDVPEFHNTNLSRMIKTARHSMAIDEHRRGFNVCRWQAKPQHTDSEQRWFVGNHTDIGGQFSNRGDVNGLSDVTLSWMATEAETHGLQLNHKIYQYKQANDWQSQIHNSSPILFPCQDYYRPLGEKADETLDDSVQKRVDRFDNYRPENLCHYLNIDPLPHQARCHIL